MGVYNTYGDKICMQMKVAPELTLEHFKVGDKVDIPDGIYIGYEGAIAVKDGILVSESDEVFDKWGGLLNMIEILDPNNPVGQAIKSLENDRPSQ